MSKKIVLAIGHYRPNMEAMSGEVQTLHGALQRLNIGVEIFQRSPEERVGMWYLWDLAADRFVNQGMHLIPKA